MAHSRRWPSSDALDDLFLKHYTGMIARAQQEQGTLPGGDIASIRRVR